MSHYAIYFSLFLLSFAAATIFPAQSEVLLAKLVIDDHYIWWLLIFVASVGNVLGSVVNWVLGRYFSHFRNRTWFPIKSDQLRKFEAHYQKYGKWSLLLSWVPIIGDPLTVIAGVLREPLPIFILLVTIAKTGRYIVTAAIAYQWI